LTLLDIAAGAPYAGEEAKGIVYIYMGSRNGIITKAMQSISASDLNFQLSTFGFSLSGGADLDANQYPGINRNRDLSLIGILHLPF
jgi:integrin alpha 7